MIFVQLLIEIFCVWAKKFCCKHSTLLCNLLCTKGKCHGIKVIR